ncbi:sialate O-acetylesterase [Thalassotalea sp. PLHSN55]|uniref:sialate O-acetylesterase n=1 Tax=Thalassotalea sp. PLHSN55 TaxID=3435888 RepID=UPI003F853273
MKNLFLLIVASLLFTSYSSDTLAKKNAEQGKHLFILSGQSNMVGLNVNQYFTPIVNKHFGADKTIVVKDAKGAQPIRRWYKNWQPQANNVPKHYQAEQNGDLYNRLMTKVNAAIEKENIASVSFIWVQGERDAREQNANIYADSFKGVLKQLKQDLNVDDIHVVIGRLSDFDMQNVKYKHWTKMRQVQQNLANNLASAAWVNTDDLNDGVNHKGKPIKNDLHYSVAGYQIFGKRLAHAAIQLINN